MGVSATTSSDTEEPAKFDKVRRFFLASEWATMTFYEKMSFVKIRKDLKRMKREGLSLELLCRFIMRFEYPPWMDVWGSNPEKDLEPSAFLSDRIEVGDLEADQHKYAALNANNGKPEFQNGSASPPGRSLLLCTRPRGTSLTPPSTSPTAAVQQTSFREQTDDTTPPKDSLDVSVLGDFDCDGCDDGEESEACPTHGPLQPVLDTEVPLGQPDRALRTLPPQLAVLPSGIPGAGLGVWTAQDVPAMVRFGPYEGEVTATDRQSGYAWEIRADDGYGDGPDYYLDGEDVSKSNWMRYVNCARNGAERNLHAYQRDGRVFYRTVRPVPALTELLVWYGDSYARDLSIEPLPPPPPPPRLRNDSAGEPSHGAGDSSPAAAISTKASKTTSARRGSGPSPSSTSRRRSRSKDPEDAKEGSCTRAQELPFRCRTCDAAFRFGLNLPRHERLHPTRCAVCKTRFEDGAALKQHLRVHPRGANIKCDSCGVPFTNVSALQAHQRRFLTARPPCCPECDADFEAAQEQHLRAPGGGDDTLDGGEGAATLGETGAEPAEKAVVCRRLSTGRLSRSTDHWQSTTTPRKRKPRRKTKRKSRRRLSDVDIALRQLRRMAREARESSIRRVSATR